MIRAGLIIPLLVLGCAAAQAQPIFRCGTSYSSTPCEGGRAIAPAATPTGAEQEAARRSAGEARTQADLLERERTAAEAEQARRIDAARRAEAARLQAERHAAVTPAKPVTNKKKARRKSGATPPADFEAFDRSSIGPKKKTKALD